MKIFERFSLHLTSGPSRSHAPTDPEADSAHLLGHAPLPTAPVPPSLVRRLLPSIQIHDRYRLGKAVANNDTHGVERALQDPHCDPNFSHSGQPPIVTAATFDNGQAVEMLLGAGANIYPLPSGWSLLGDAARNRRNNAAKALLSAPGVHAHHIEPDQRSPLTIAAEAGELALLKVLLERQGTRVNALDGRNLSAMDAALRAGQFKAVELLLEFGAEIPAGAADIRLPDDWSLLGAAVRDGHDKAALALLAAPGARARRDEPDHRSAFTIAAEQGNLPLLRAMLKDENTLSKIDSRDARGFAALHAAVCAKQLEAVELLLEFDAEPGRNDDHGHTTVWHAINVGDAAILRTLLKATQQKPMLPKTSTLPQYICEQALAHVIAKGDVACAIVLIEDPRVDLDTPIDGDRTFRALAGCHLDLREELEPERVFVRRHGARAIVARLQEHPAERPALLEALAKVGDLDKLRPLVKASDLQGDIVNAVERAVGSRRWPVAAALVRGVAPDWRPDGAPLSEVLEAPGMTAHNRKDRLVVAHHAGRAQHKALRGADGAAYAMAWQQDLQHLPARLVALIIASSGDQQAAWPDQPDAYQSMFELRHVPSDQRHEVNRQTRALWTSVGLSTSAKRNRSSDSLLPTLFQQLNQHQA